MKKILLILAFLSSQVALAQDATKFAVGTKINYALNFKGSDVEYDLTIKTMADPMVLGWDVPSYGTGTYELPQKALQSGTLLNFDQVEPNSATRLKETETVIFISKDSFSALRKNGAFTCNGLVFSKKAETTPLAIQIGGKALDLIHVISADGATQMWILNNENFPLIAQLKGNPADVNYTLTSITN
jgi:hypothetical protein